MNSGKIPTIWIPLALGAAGVLLGLALAKFWATLPEWASVVGVIVAILLVAWAIYLAYQRQQEDRLQGGVGGRASAFGVDSEATGGSGGDAGWGDGGAGGSAIAKGKRSIARGGNGGRG